MTHEMILTNGVWRCVACTREFILEFHPYRQLVIADGDLTATHTGSTGPLRILDDGWADRVERAIAENRE